MTTNVFKYNGNEITFNAGDSVMVNATDMAKPFGKTPYEFLRLPSTERFLTVYEASGESLRSEIIRQVNGVGTWMHEDIALEFARWLSPIFAFWCNDRIKELMKFGITATPTAIEDILNDPDFGIRILSALKTERERNTVLAEENKLKLAQIIEKDRQIYEAEPKILFAEMVSGSGTSILVREFAKLLSNDGFHIGGNRLFAWLRTKGFVNANNEPYQQYVSMGLFERIERVVGGGSGTFSTFTTKITGKGQVYLTKKFRSDHSTEQTKMSA